ncbi:MAG: HIT family protein [archaeon]
MEEDIGKIKEKILEELSKLSDENSKEMFEKIEAMDDAEFSAFLKEYAMPLQQCLFCQISQGKIPTVKVYESKNILAVMDINPASKGHMIVMPKQHYQFLTQLPDPLLFEIFSFARHVIPSMIRTVKSQGVALSILQGKEQAVPHFALNIIPRFNDDKLDLFMQRQKIPRQEIETVASAIRKDAGESAKPPILEKKIEKEKPEEKIQEKEQPKETKQDNAGYPEHELDKFFRRRIPN